jgi:hypothetical protein
MNGVYTNLAKKRVEQSKETRKLNSLPPPPVKPVAQEEQGKKDKQNGTLSAVPLSETNKRPVKPRHGFDIYVDQYADLVKWSNEEKLQGGTGSMSRMAREALDMYIAARKKK